MNSDLRHPSHLTVYPNAGKDLPLEKEPTHVNNMFQPTVVASAETTYLKNHKTANNSKLKNS